MSKHGGGGHWSHDMFMYSCCSQRSRKAALLHRLVACAKEAYALPLHCLLACLQHICLPLCMLG